MDTVWWSLSKMSENTKSVHHQHQFQNKYQKDQIGRKQPRWEQLGRLLKIIKINNIKIVFFKIEHFDFESRVFTKIWFGSKFSCQNLFQQQIVKWFESKWIWRNQFIIWA